VLTSKVALKHIPFSDANILSLTNANIKVHSLKLINAKEEEVRKLGGMLGTPDALSLDETKRFIAYIRKYVSFEVSLHTSLSSGSFHCAL